MNYTEQRRWRRFINRAMNVKNPHCEYCGKSFRGLGLRDSVITGDHRLPQCRGGESTWENFALVCRQCNKRKGPLTVEEFLPIMHDNNARQELIRQVHYDLGHNPNVYGSQEELYVRAREKRLEALADRLIDPNPDCPFCLGSGWMPNRALVYCPCSMADIKPKGPRGRRPRVKDGYEASDIRADFEGARGQ